jgi:hypothetical protein
VELGVVGLKKVDKSTLEYVSINFDDQGPTPEQCFRHRRHDTFFVDTNGGIADKNTTLFQALIRSIRGRAEYPCFPEVRIIESTFKTIQLAALY